MIKAVFSIIFAASAASAGIVALTGADGTTRLVPVPAEGTNWVGSVGVTAAGEVVTNAAAWRAHGRRGWIEWADGTRSQFRVPDPGEVVAVGHEARQSGRGRQRLRFGEVVWIDHEGHIVSNYIGKAYRELAGHSRRLQAARGRRPAEKMAAEDGEAKEDKARAAAKRTPEPDPEGRVYIQPGSRNRRRGKAAVPAKRPQQKRTAKAAPEDPEKDDEAAIDEYRAKAGAQPTRTVPPRQ